jgi:hypothetical protein
MNKLFFMGLICLTLVSCEKEIQIDLNSAEPKLVVEAYLSDQSDTATVTLTRTVNFSDPSTYPAISDAIVVITDLEGNTWNCTQSTPGTYQNTNLRGKIGQKYFLSITTADGQKYTAESTLPAPVMLDKIDFRELAFGPPGGGGGDSVSFALIPRYFDPADAQNNYRFIQTVNGERDLSIQVKNDNIFDGRVNEQPLFSVDVEIYSGDIVTLEMMCIDKGAYDYFFSLSQYLSTNGPNAAGVPANPVSNISNGALGYFSAFSFQKRTVVVP